MQLSTKRLMMTVLLLAAELCFGAAPPAEVPFLGTFTGTGRACFGKLQIKAKTLTWITTWSKCRNVPYEVLERKQDGSEQTITFLLKRQDKGCRYIVISLHHSRETLAFDWEAIGYQSLNDFKERAEANTLGCPMIREDEPTGSGNLGHHLQHPSKKTK